MIVTVDNIESSSGSLFEYRVISDGGYGIVGYYGLGGDVTIPATINGYPVTKSHEAVGLLRRTPLILNKDISLTDRHLLLQKGLFVPFLIAQTGLVCVFLLLHKLPQTLDTPFHLLTFLIAAYIFCKFYYLGN